MAGDWVKLEADIIWAQRDGQGVSANGRRTMKSAVAQGNVNYMGMYKEGFYDCQNRPAQRLNFDVCAEQNQGRVYNIGRRVDGLPEI